MRKVIFMLTLYTVLTFFLLIDEAAAAEHYVDTSIMFPDLPTKADVENPDSDLYGLSIGKHYIIYYDHNYNSYILILYDEVTYSGTWYGGYRFVFSNTSHFKLDSEHLRWTRNEYQGTGIDEKNYYGDNHSIMYNEQDLYVGDTLVFQSTLLREPLALVVQRTRQGGKTILSLVLGQVTSLIPLVLSAIILYLGLRKGLILLRTRLIHS